MGLCDGNTNTKNNGYGGQICAKKNMHRCEPIWKWDMYTWMELTLCSWLSIMNVALLKSLRTYLRQYDLVHLRNKSRLTMIILKEFQSLENLMSAICNVC